MKINNRHNKKIMTDFKIIESIKQEEIDFPKRFASFEEREYGVLYYMDDNKDSYDGNHACIYPEAIRDLGAVLDDITAFYEMHDIRASIYHPYAKNYFNDNASILREHGYSHVSQPDHRVMLLTADNCITNYGALEISVSDKWDNRVATDILIPSGEPWEIDVTKKRLQKDGTLLFVGSIDGRAVVYTDIHTSDNGNTRFDYIVTSSNCRGRGYASELLSFVVEYCKDNRLPNCWQWAGPSESICYKAGFREAFTMEAGYAKRL